MHTTGLFRWLLALLVVAAGIAQAQAPTPVLHAHINDTIALLDKPRAEALEARLVDLEKRKGAQVVVLIVDSLHDESIETYAVRVFEAWKLGRQKVDDGVLLVVAKNDRKMRIEVGYGLEGAIPDVIAHRVIEDYLRPAFRADDFVGGIEQAVDALSKAVDGEPLPTPTSRTVVINDSPWWSPFYLLPAGFIGLFSALFLCLCFCWVGSARRRYVVGGLNALLLTWIFPSPWSFLSAGFIGFGFGTIIGIDKMSKIGSGRRGHRSAGTRRPGDDAYTTAAASSSSWSSSSSSSSDNSSSSSSSSDYSGGGGESGGGGSSGDW